MIPVLSFVGKADSGKTTYLEKLIAEMKRRGHKLAIIKHDVHGFEMDHPGKDTWRHAQAGADIVCISSPAKYAIIAKVAAEMPLAELAARIDGVDVIFTEGYKREGKTRIEIFRPPVADEPLCRQDELVAIVSDAPVYPGLPRFGLADPAAMADFIETRFLRKEG
jgi:molybdopterin-guanine dinucleotide biosynthesis protein B